MIIIANSFPVPLDHEIQDGSNSVSTPLEFSALEKYPTACKQAIDPVKFDCL